MGHARQFFKRGQSFTKYYIQLLHGHAYINLNHSKTHNINLEEFFKTVFTILTTNHLHTGYARNITHHLDSRK